MNPSVVVDNLGYLMVGAWPEGPIGGLALTLTLSGLSGLASAALGLVLGIALAMSAGAARAALTAGLGFLRAVPVVMLIFWTYFLLPTLFGVSIPEVGTVAAALSLVGGAYLSHGVAAGIASVGRGQWEAGLALGLGPWRTLQFVILPQALRPMAPSFVNQWTALIKDTSLAYVIGVPELAFVAAQVNNRAMVYPAEIFLFVGAVYGALCVSLDGLASWVTSPGKVPAHRAQ
ncbi:amino acid ABC transporter permease [Methylobacterium sp. NMS14P]|uniref:amino acid ABC transporter permease n=1 Tax=Methylobacterium sp. NMS14P TaxID=2894310 RepID=UPI00235998AC|nr:amino acid ABC transporter permease [Methylobacterium sp. NMS14P]WCS27496.1 amino acid ABC transporter permease [Methylobacterium sp. NMS14P]